MNNKENLYKALKGKQKVFAFLIVLLIFIDVFVIFITSQVFGNTPEKILTDIVFVALPAGIIFFIAKKQILEYKKLIKNTKPIRCTVEDLIVLGSKFTSSSEVSFDAYILLRSLEDNQLYFSYGSYLLESTGKTFVKRTPGNITVQYIRPDGEILRQGDNANMYISKIERINVEANKMSDRVKLDGNSYSFLSAFGTSSVDDIRRAKIFTGAIDVKDTPDIGLSSNDSSSWDVDKILKEKYEKYVLK